ncbi:MAG: 50S ribosomal protein L11 methyltransferase [Actinomycetota bacterium]|nr:50S ribosomal protein L11 methyltransferase [Actinomycetota bacterium]
MRNDALLELADGLSITRKNASFKVSLGHVEMQGGRYTLPILDAFSTPRTLRDALTVLEGDIQGTAGWVELIGHVKALYELGALVEPTAVKGLRRAHDKRFDSAPIHVRMLNDERRTSSFQTAIRRTVRPGDVVLEIGTGTGVLAVTAAMAGARHVYAVEATAMSRIARRLVEINGVADGVTIIEGHSFDISLPERADVLISEIIGDDPLGEQILPTFADARERLLVADARMIPSRLRLRALPLEVPHEALEGFRFTPARAALWAARYGIDFTALVLTSESQDHLVHVNSYDTRTWKRLAEPISVGDFDLLSFEPGRLEQQVPFRATLAGSVSGVLLIFEADLGGGVELSLHPDQATPSNSWGNLLYLFAEPIPVVRGQELRLEYDFDRRSRIRLTSERGDESLSIDEGLSEDGDRRDAPKTV